MRERLLALRERRAQLVIRAAAERARLGRFVASTDRASEWLALGARLADEAKRRPVWIFGAVALLFALRPKRTFKLLLSGWSLWRLYRQARRWWMLLEARAS